MKTKLRAFSFILLILISLNTVVLGLTSYEQYYNADYSYSLRVPHDSASKIIETNRAAVIIPYTNQIRLQINVYDVSNLLTSEEKEGVNMNKITLKSPVFEKTYGSFDWVKKNAGDIVSDFETSSKVTKVEEISVDHCKAFQIYYNTEIIKSDGTTGKGHGMLIFTVTNGHVFNFIFTDNKMKEKNITDYDFVQKAISTIDLEDVDYKPFIFIGLFCAVLWLLLMSLYLKAERMAKVRKERRRKEKELTQKREEGYEMVGQDDDFEYYDQILLEEAESEEQGDNIFTIEQIMEMYPSLKNVQIRPKGSLENIVTENENVIDYKALDEQKQLEEEAKKKAEEEADENNPWKERISETDAAAGFVFEDVNDEISEEERKHQESLDLSFNSENKKESEGVSVEEYGLEVSKESVAPEGLGYQFDDQPIDKSSDTVTINSSELYEEMKKTEEENADGNK